MTIVELNTFFLILKRHVPPSKFLELAFQLTWLVTRVIWFPVFAIYAIFFSSGWQAGLIGSARRVVTCSCIAFLAILQLQWTRNALTEKKKTDEVDEDDGFL